MQAYKNVNDINTFRNGRRGIVGWKRPGEIWGDDFSLLGSYADFKPQGIRQGMLGDCWFLAGATALAEHPERLYNVIHTNSRGYDGYT